VTERGSDVAQQGPRPPWWPAGLLRLSATPRALTLAMVASLMLFTTGVGARPTGAAWGWAYDLVLYNVVFLLAAVASWQAASRLPGRTSPGRWLAFALAVNAAGNVVYTLVFARMTDPPYPSVSDLLYLAYYPPVYVALVRLARARVASVNISMWLDGLIGATGAAAVAIAVLLAPAWGAVGGSGAELATNLAFPAADVVLLALLVGAGGVLGLRSDAALRLFGAGLLCNLVGDIVYLDLEATGRYTEGGPLDLTWLLGVVFMALAVQRPAPAAGPVAAARAGKAALVEWRVLAVPLASGVASVALLGAGWGDRMPLSVACCAVGCLLTVVVRTAVTFRELRSLRDVGREARTDELTGLPNRRGLLERVERELADVSTDRPLALLLLDLDGFKEVNDGLGHHAGDDLLRQVGSRLRPLLRPADTLARLGGDEFAVLLPDTGPDNAEVVAHKLSRGLGAPFSVGDVRLHVGGSFGVAAAPDLAGTVEELLRCADVAMYAAKDGPSTVEVYRAAGAGGSGDRLRVMEELRNALTTDELLVHLQPQISLPDRRVVGVEALVRWQHPTRGLLLPGDLLPAAEQAGLMGPLADAVLDLALAGAARWWSRTAEVPVSVNISAANVTDLDLPAKVTAALARHGLPPRALTLELVEDTLMTNPDRARAVLGQLRATGVATSIDDYGTGYSSLAYLRHLPADELKLDRAFLEDVGTDPRAAAIVEHTVGLAHALDLRLVAEGVEDSATIDVLADLGCDVVQGFAIARPMPVDDLLVWLLQPRGVPAQRTAV
jgi:diguanylate cyclase